MKSWPQSSLQITGAEVAERSEAPEAPRYPLKASFQFIGAEGAERSEAHEAPRYHLKASFQLVGAEEAERSEAPEAPRYPWMCSGGARAESSSKFSSRCLGVEAGIIGSLGYCSTILGEQRKKLGIQNIVEQNKKFTVQTIKMTTKTSKNFVEQRKSI